MKDSIFGTLVRSVKSSLIFLFVLTVFSLSTQTISYASSNALLNSSAWALAASSSASSNVCAVYPFILPEEDFANVSAGTSFNYVYSGTLPGSFGSLSWNGNQDANTLADSFIPPGTAQNYINPLSPNDNQLDIGDPVYVANGKKKSKSLRDNLDAIAGQEIIVPLWDSYLAKQDAPDAYNLQHSIYYVSGYAKIILTDYALNPKDNDGVTGHWISFEYVGSVGCSGNTAPVADGQSLMTDEDAALDITLSATDPEGDDLNFTVQSQPQNGTLSGTAPNLTYTPDANYFGEDNFTFSAFDGEFESELATITITVNPVNDSPEANPVTITTDEDVAASFTLSGSDLDGDALTYLVQDQPQNGTLSGTAPNLTYTPNANYSGSDSFTYVANDGTTDSVPAIVTITVNPINDAPLANDQSLETNEDSALDILLSGNDIEGDSLSYQVLTQPTNGTLSGSAPNLMYTPNENFNGSDNFTFLVNDGSEQSNTATVSITVNPVNDAPVADDQSVTTDEDTALAIILSASDLEGDTLTYALQTQAINGTLSGTAPNLTYTPNADFNGSDSFTFTVNDGTDVSNTATISITVNPVNDAPVADDQAVSVDEDSNVAITLTASDLDNDNLTYTLQAQPTNGTLSGTVPNLSYTPNADFNGSDSFTFTVNDGVDVSNIATVSITVNPVNDAPVADDQVVTTDEDIALAISLSGSDLEGEALTYALLSQPASGALSGTAPNLTYTPNADFNGSDSFTFTVNDGTDVSNTANISITVNPVNDAPIADDQSVTTNEDTALAITLSGSDLEGDTLTYALQSQPINGTLIGTVPNLTYTPNADFNGSDNFTFTVNDGVGVSNTATVSIVVSPVNDVPTAFAQMLVTDEDIALAITLTGFDVDSNNLTYTVINQPANGSLSGTGSDLIYLPNNNFNGTDSFTFVISDGELSSETAIVSIAVTPVNDKPIAENQSVQTNEDTEVQIVLAGSDAENSTLSYLIQTQPLHGSLVGVGANVAYQPSPDFNGIDTFTYYVNDGTENSEVATVTITVISVNDAPRAFDASYSLLADESLNFSLTSIDSDGDTVSYTLVTQPANGVLTGTLPDLTFTPNANFSGTDSFTFSVNDGNTDSNLATITLDVIEPNLPPEIISSPVTFVQASNVYEYSVIAEDPNVNDTLTYSLIEGPQGMSIDSHTGLITWQNPIQGNYSISVLVRDSLDEQASQTFNLLVAGELPANTNAGKEFFFMFNHNVVIDELNVIVSSNFATDVKLEIPALGISEEKTLEPNTLSTFNLIDFVDLLALDQEGINDKSIIVSSDKPIFAYLYNSAEFTTDGTYILPINSLGKEHIVASWSEIGTGLFNFGSLFGIVSPYNDNTVTITPIADFNDGIELREEGISFDITLQRGETYQAIDNTVDLAGTQVDSLKPIALFSGNVCASVQANYCDHLIEQTPSIDSWGVNYYTHPFTTRRGGDTFRIYSSAPESILEINGYTFVMDQLYIDLILEESSHIKADNPILVTQLSNGSDFDYVSDPRNGDPFILVVPPAEQYLSNYIVTTPSTVLSNHFVNIIAHTHVKDQIVQNGSMLDNPQWVKIQDSDFYATSIRIEDGVHTFSGPDNFGLYSYGFDADNSYGYLGGMGLADSSITANQITIELGSLAPLVGNEQCINANVLDANGQPITQVQVDFTRSLLTSSTQEAGTIMTNFNGVAVYCYTHPVSETEQIIASYQGITGTTEFTWQANLTSDNLPPLIYSKPEFYAEPSVLYSYQLLAGDPNNDILTYELLESPAGMIIDQSGLITWNTPNSFDESKVKVRVTDLSGLYDEQYYQIRYLPGSNRYPLITELPERYIAVEHTHDVFVRVVDLDGDALSQTLVSGPDGLIMINPTNGFMRWYDVPQSMLGDHPVIVDITDSNGATTRAEFILTVVPNSAPEVVTEPVSSVKIGEVYDGRITYADVDRDAVDVSVVNGPAGLTVSLYSSAFKVYKIDWTPPVGFSGSVPVTLKADDGYTDGVSFYTYNILVTENRPPQFVSQPDLTATAGQQYRYQLEGIDPDGDNLTYRLVQAPANMYLSFNNEIIWYTNESLVGTNSVIVEVKDTDGATALQEFDIYIFFENGPQITSLPIKNAKAGNNYIYDVEATDPNNDNLTYTLPVAPQGMTINEQTGVITWTPDTAGENSVTVEVSDGTLIASQSWILSVIDSSISLSPSLTLSPEFINENEITLLTVSVEGAAGSYTIDATVDAQAIVLDTNNQATITGTTLGEHVVSVTVTDTEESVTVTDSFFVKDPNDTTAPIVRFDSPIDSSKVLTATSIVGSVTDDNLAFWELRLAPVGELTGNPSSYSVIAEGTNSFMSSPFHSFDPTMLLNGYWDLHLVAFDESGQREDAFLTLQVDSDLKVGNFSITFEDFNIPVAGIPITLTRTYDSRRRFENLDFGYGWSVDYQNVRLQENRIQGEGWNQSSSGGAFPTYCVEGDGEHSISVTLPDGRIEEFDLGFELACQQLVPLSAVTPKYVARPGTFSTLVPEDVGQLLVQNGLLIDAGTGSAYNVDRFTMTTVEGMVYELDQNFGITSVTDTNGNTLTFSDSGVTHSSGEALTFTRDAQGRITDITAPDGTFTQYMYDEQGDLRIFSDQLGQNTEFTYNLNHGLLDIIDPRGVRVSRNEYDDDGRLIATIDAEGNRIEYTHDLANNTEQVTDRRGFVTTYVYDDEGNILTETNALDETITRTYDDDHNELTVMDALGNVTTNTFDGNNNQLTEMDPLGNLTQYAYDSEDQILTLTDPAGNVVVDNVYDDNKNLTSLTDALGQTTQFAYDLNGNLTQQTDALNQAMTYTYSSQGYKLSETDVAGVTTSYTYDDMGRALTESTTRTDANGELRTLVTCYEYDAKGRLIKTTDPLGNISLMEYNAIDKVIKETDANNNVTMHEYDVRGNKVKTIYADLTEETWVYDKANNMQSQTDRNGHTTTMEYDAANRLIKTTYADLSFTTVEYDLAGRQTATVDARGNRTEYTYDIASRNITVKDALNQVTTYGYDSRGNRISMLDARGNTMTYTFDDLNRLVTTTYPDATTKQVSFDALGRKVSDTDQAGLVTQYAYDSRGNLTKVTDALLQDTTYTYDEQSNKLTQTDAELRTTTWNYDDLGRVVGRSLPLGQSESMTYDAVGNMLTRTDFNGAVTNYTYDILNRNTLMSYADGKSIATEYTDNGLPFKVTDHRGITMYAYDNRDRMTNIVYPNGQDIQYQYDANGNRTQLIASTGSVGYSFDVLNRLATVEDGDISNPNVTTYLYDAVGNRSGVNHANGNQTRYTYDALNRLTNIEVQDSATNVLSSHAYTLAPAGQRTSETTETGRVVDYTYDDLYRLTEESTTDATIGNRVTTYTYDKVGNRLSQVENGQITNYTYNNNDQILAENVVGGDTTSYAYDANGNTLTKTKNMVATVYSYDSRDKLESMDDGSQFLQYEYDASGIRQAKSVDGVREEFLVDPLQAYAQVIAAFDELGNPIATYTYGLDRVSETIIGNTSYYHFDGLGSTRKLSDSSGLVSDTYTYKAFGEVEHRIGTTANEYLFTGEQYDANLGFYYLRARYYNPANGRMWGLDTYQGRVYDPRTLHKYLYTHADPVNNIDPSGNMSLGSIGATIRVMTTNVLRSSANLARTFTNALKRTVNNIAKKFKRKNKKKPRNDNEDARDRDEAIVLLESYMGAGYFIKGDLKDAPRLNAVWSEGIWVKMKHRRQIRDRVIVVHYFMNINNSQRVEFKFKSR